MRDESVLLKAVRERQLRGGKSEPFRYGISTADLYVSTLADVVGRGRCGRQFARDGQSWGDVLLKAAKTLVYANPDMDEPVEEVYGAKRATPSLPGLDLPKNTLVAFSHVLTSSRKDRDGDVLHADGARLDPKMLLLWQHVHTQPIGKLVAVRDQNPGRLTVVSAIVDMNELCHDAAVMIDSGMGRFSHGFRAIEFEKIKAAGGDKEGVGDGGGFEVTEFEVMEESLVSVPANVDAQTEEVLLSLVEGGRLKSAVMKAVGRGIRGRRVVQVGGVTYRERENGRVRELVCSTLGQLKAAADAGIVGVKHEKQGDSGAGRAGEGTGRETGAGAAGAPEEADVKAGEGKEEGAADKEMMTCPECGERARPDEDGNCPECGKPMKAGSVKEGGDAGLDGQKPYPSEHAARQEEPGKFEKFRRENDKLGEGVSVVWGIDADGKAHVQSIRFDAGKFTPGEARAWLREHKFSADQFEPAKEAKKVETADGTKAGRVLSRGNEELIRKAKEHVDDVHDTGREYLKRGHGAQLREASAYLKTVLDGVAAVEGSSIEEKPRVEPTKPHGGPMMMTVGQASAHVLAHATSADRKVLIAALRAVDDAEESAAKAAAWARAKAGKLMEGNLHEETHRGNEMMPGKEVRSWLVKMGMSCGGSSAGSARVEHTGKEVRSYFVKAGWEHTAFRDEKAARRTDAFHMKDGVKATAVYVVGQKGADVYMSRPKQKR